MSYINWYMDINEIKSIRNRLFMRQLFYQKDYESRLKKYVTVGDLKQSLDSQITMSEKQKEEPTGPPRRTYYLIPSSGSKRMMKEGTLVMGRQGPWKTVDEEVPPREQKQTLVGGFPSQRKRNHHNICRRMSMVDIQMGSFIEIIYPILHHCTERTLAS